jgi:hypothetical protein
MPTSGSINPLVAYKLALYFLSLFPLGKGIFWFNERKLKGY